MSILTLIPMPIDVVSSFHFRIQITNRCQLFSFQNTELQSKSLKSFSPPKKKTKTLLCFMCILTLTTIPIDVGCSFHFRIQITNRCCHLFSFQNTELQSKSIKSFSIPQPIATQPCAINVYTDLDYNAIRHPQFFSFQNINLCSCLSFSSA